MEYSFQSKWSKLKTKEPNADERSLFVEAGHEPITQRQLNLYYYFLFVKEVLKREKAKNVLEIGCGRGTLALYLAERTGLTLSLLDNVPDAIEIARNEFGKHQKQATFYVGEACATGLRDNMFDAVVSIGLAEHFESVDELFKEQYRILKDGGVMISLNIPDKPFALFPNRAMRFGKKLLGTYKSDIGRDYYRNKFSAKEYKESAERVGFKDVSVTYVAPFPLFTPLSLKVDRNLTTVYKIILKLKRLFQKYPYKTNFAIAQAHFLVGYRGE